MLFGVSEIRFKASTLLEDSMEISQQDKPKTRKEDLY